MPIDPSGLYWIAGLPNGLQPGQLSLDGLDNAHLLLRDLPVIDEPTFPQPGPVYHAYNTIDVHWHATGNQQTLTNPSMYFSITGRPASIEAEFTVSEPSQGFSFRGHATAITYSFLGSEKNGYFYDASI